MIQPVKEVSKKKIKSIKLKRRQMEKMKVMNECVRTDLYFILIHMMVVIDKLRWNMRKSLQSTAQIV